MHSIGTTKDTVLYCTVYIGNMYCILYLCSIYLLCLFLKCMYSMRITSHNTITSQVCKLGIIRKELNLWSAGRGDSHFFFSREDITNYKVLRSAMMLQLHYVVFQGYISYSFFAFLLWKLKWLYWANKDRKDVHKLPISQDYTKIPVASFKPTKYYNIIFWFRISDSDHLRLRF
jgi:hypothetical protein